MTGKTQGLSQTFKKIKFNRLNRKYQSACRRDKYCSMKLFCINIHIYIYIYTYIYVYTHTHVGMPCINVHIYMWTNMMKNDFFLPKMFISHFLRQEITGMFFWKKLNRPREVLKSFNGPEPGGLELTDKKVKQRERGWYSLVYTGSQ